jgi:hypothetical protein
LVGKRRRGRRLELRAGYPSLWRRGRQNYRRSCPLNGEILYPCAAFGVTVHPPSGSAGVPPAKDAAKRAALPGKSRACHSARLLRANPAWQCETKPAFHAA